MRVSLSLVRVAVLVVFASAFVGTVGEVRAQAPNAKGRDPWLWPFSSESIWNMPIGSSAVYKPANLGPAPRVGVDSQFLVRTSADDPEREVLNSPSFKTRSTGTTPL